MWAEDEADLLLAAATGAELDRLVDRRVAGEPLEQVLGWAALCGERIGVRPGVFLPRRRTELLVRETLALAPPHPVVLDLCCGTGALGLVLARRLVGVELHAADVEPAAVACARDNLGPLGAVYLGDLFAPLPADLRGRVDLLLCNVPYVPTGELGLLPPEARLHEPRVTLDGGHDGLAVLGRVAGQAASWLRPGGTLLTETSAAQVRAAQALLRRGGLSARVAYDDDLDATVVLATRPA